MIDGLHFFARSHSVCIKLAPLFNFQMKAHTKHCTTFGDLHYAVFKQHLS